MSMRPFNPYTEDIEMYLEEAKERGLIIPNQDSLKKWAAKVNAQNEEIVRRDEPSREHQTLKKKVEQDEKEEKEKYINYVKEFDKKKYKEYVKEFDKKYHRGWYDSKNKKVSRKHYFPKPDPNAWPSIWSTSGVVIQPHFEKNSFEMPNFDIVVDTESKTHFTSDFPRINTAWSDSNKSNDITQVKFDIADPYFSSLANAYKIFCLSGFSLQHLNSTDPFVKSLCLYFVYYWLAILQRNPYSPSKEIIEYLQKNHPTKKTWTKEFHQGMETPTWWMKRQPEYKMGRMRNARPVFAKERRFGQVGISYEKVTHIGPRGDDDWKDLIPKTSKGFTRLGQKIFQQSLESLIFCILDAQAKTGWSITEQGAKSYQTQEVFRKLVQDTIMQNDVTITINDMKKAIVDTGVSLNFALIPNTILIPSDMRLQVKIPGFNNILDLANSKFMHFGENKNVHPREQKPVKDTEQKPVKDTEHSDPPKSYVDEKQKSHHFYTGKKDNIQTESKSESSIETTIIGGVAAGLLLRLVLWLF